MVDPNPTFVAPLAGETDVTNGTLSDRRMSTVVACPAVSVRGSLLPWQIGCLCPLRQVTVKVLFDPTGTLLRSSVMTSPLRGLKTSFSVVIGIRSGAVT